MDHYRQVTNNKAVAWALLSQSLWLPLVGIDLHERWQAETRLSRSLALPSAQLAASLPPAPSLNPVAVAPSSLDTRAKASAGGVLLGASSPAAHAQVGHLLDRAVQYVSVGEAAVNGRPSKLVLQASSHSSGLPRPSAMGALASASGYDLLQRSFTPAELLGGALTLHDLDAAPIPAVALSERARLARSADPLAPLPQAWREPMRHALNAISITSPLKRPALLESARVVHVPSMKVTRTTAVPLALQSDGSVDLLTKPEDPAVLEAIRGWSGRQDLPASGRLTPAIVHVEPLKELPPLRSTAGTTHPDFHSARSVAPASPASAVLPSRIPAVLPAAKSSAPAPSAAIPPVSEIRRQVPAPKPAVEAAAPQAVPQSAAPSNAPPAPVAPITEVAPAPPVSSLPQASLPAPSAPQPAP